MKKITKFLIIFSCLQIFTTPIHASDKILRLGYGAGSNTIGNLYYYLEGQNNSTKRGFAAAAGYQLDFGKTASYTYHFISPFKPENIVTKALSRCVFWILECDMYSKKGLGLMYADSSTYYDLLKTNDSVTEVGSYNVPSQFYGLLTYEIVNQLKSSGLFYTYAFTYRSPFKKINPELKSGEFKQTQVDHINSLYNNSLGFNFSIGFRVL